MRQLDEMTCTHCSRDSDTRIECKIGKNDLVYLQVHCERCGVYSHDLVYGALNRSIREAIRKDRANRN